MYFIMKKKNLKVKLSLKKSNVSKLDGIKGGYVTAPVLCGTANCGTGNCGSWNCPSANCPSDNCYTNQHPVSDPLHCRTCNDWC